MLCQLSRSRSLTTGFACSTPTARLNSPRAQRTAGDSRAEPSSPALLAPRDRVGGQVDPRADRAACQELRARRVGVVDRVVACAAVEVEAAAVELGRVSFSKRPSAGSQYRAR